MARRTVVDGTFTATGQSDTCYGKNIQIKLDFAGTASVDIEQAIGANWIKIATAITADYSQVFASPTTQEIRLNCTAYTNDVVYQMAAAIND